MICQTESLLMNMCPTGNVQKNILPLVSLVYTLDCLKVRLLTQTLRPLMLLDAVACTKQARHIPDGTNELMLCC
jgi:hypothetical protein